MLKEWLVPHRSRVGANFEVKRSLPFRGGRGVGPFVFLDHMGPHRLVDGGGMNVAPHPHIGLSTLTYLFEGVAIHRDSLGTVQKISPLDVNWMTAGRGIAHSERMPQGSEQPSGSIHGLQAWVALPKALERCDPSFEHVPRDQLPVVESGGAHYRVVVGEALGQVSPVRVHQKLFYVHCRFDSGYKTDLSFGEQEVALYLVSGAVLIEGKRYEAPGLLIFETGQPVNFEAASAIEAMLLGGEHLPEHRTIWWNFVATDRALIDEAKKRWRSGEFPPVPGETTSIPLPE